MSENYIVSARKYRPQTFDTVVGQEHITTTLKNAIKNNHLAHAYLFCGPRGVGKTTCARILAKTINCQSPTAEMEACGKCSTCQAFADHTSFNVFELDAASNNSVDDIRELVNQVRFAPQAGKYKVYIIDEVHMLSASAFNAFLKTLEEPPPYAIFILATTEKHKILPTILSRCQIFDFKRITSDSISAHLHSIATKEGVVAQEAALHVIAQKSEGCMRDALSMFDRIVSFTNGMLTYNNTMEHLNLLDADFYFTLVDHMLAQDVSSTLLQLDSALERGFEGDAILDGLAEHFRNLLLCKDARMAKLLDVPNDHKPVYFEKANQAPPSFIISGLNVVNEAELSYRNANNKRLHVEMCLIRLCYLLQALEPAEVKKNTSSVVPPAPQPVAIPQQAPPQLPKSEYKQPVHESTNVAEPKPEKPAEPVIETPPQKASYSPPRPKAKTGGNKNRRISSNLLDEIDEAVNSSATEQREQKELSQQLVDDLYSVYKGKVFEAQKLMLHSQLNVMKLELYPPDEIRIVSPTDLTDTYAKDNRDDLLEYFREKTGVVLRVTTEVRLDKAVEEEQRDKVLSKPEVFEAMIKKNPALAKLRDTLGLQIDY